ncbi:unnamed protein product [Cercospora beticola]|nr:unnamed protein product [Cercospora beticola]
MYALSVQLCRIAKQCLREIDRRQHPRIELRCEDMAIPTTRLMHEAGAGQCSIFNRLDLSTADELRHDETRIDRSRRDPISMDLSVSQHKALSQMPSHHEC